MTLPVSRERPTEPEPYREGRLDAVVSLPTEALAEEMVGMDLVEGRGVKRVRRRRQANPADNSG